MRSCEEYAELISRLADDDLSDAETADVQAHIECCESCRALFLAFSSLSDYIENELEEPSEELHENIMAGIRRSRLEAVKTEKAMRKKLFSAVAAVAALAVICYTVPLFSHFGNKVSSKTAASGTEYQAVYESASEEAAEESLVLGDTARANSAPALFAASAEDSAMPEFCDIIFLLGDDSKAFESLLEKANPLDGGKIPEGWSCCHEVVVERTGIEYVVYCFEDSVCISDIDGNCYSLEAVGSAEIHSAIGIN